MDKPHCNFYYKSDVPFDENESKISISFSGDPTTAQPKVLKKGSTITVQSLSLPIGELYVDGDDIPTMANKIKKLDNFIELDGLIDLDAAKTTPIDEGLNPLSVNITYKTKGVFYFIPLKHKDGTTSKVSTNVSVKLQETRNYTYQKWRDIDIREKTIKVKGKDTKIKYFDVEKELLKYKNTSDNFIEANLLDAESLKDNRVEKGSNVILQWFKKNDVYNDLKITFNTTDRITLSEQTLFQLYNWCYVVTPRNSNIQQIQVKNTRSWRHKVYEPPESDFIKNLDKKIYGNKIPANFDTTIEDYKFLFENLKNEANTLTASTNYTDHFFDIYADTNVPSRNGCAVYYSKINDRIYMKPTTYYVSKFTFDYWTKALSALSMVGGLVKGVKNMTVKELMDSSDIHKNTIFKHLNRVGNIVKFNITWGYIYSFNSIERYFNGMCPLYMDADEYSRKVTRLNTTADSYLSGNLIKTNFKVTKTILKSETEPNNVPRPNSLSNSINGNTIEIGGAADLNYFNGTFSRSTTLSNTLIINDDVNSKFPLNDITYIKEPTKNAVSINTNNYFLYGNSGNTIKFPIISPLPYDIAAAFTVTNFTESFKIKTQRFKCVTDTKMNYTSVIKSDITLDSLDYEIYDFKGNKFVGLGTNFKDLLISYNYKKMMDDVNRLEMIMEPKHAETMILTTQKDSPGDVYNVFIRTESMVTYFSNLNLSGIDKNNFTCKVELLSCSLPTKNSVTEDVENRRIFVCVSGIPNSCKLNINDKSHNCIGIMSLNEITNWKYHVKEKTRVDVNLDRRGPHFTLPFYFSGLNEINNSYFYFVNNSGDIVSFDKDKNGQSIVKPLLPHLTVRYSFYTGDVGW